MLIDTHCHLNDPEAFPDPEEFLAEARMAGVERVIVVGVEPESCRRALALAEAHEGVFAIVGWHPNYTANYTDEGLAGIEEMLAHPKVVALGEIGLDFHWQYATLEQQERALYAQLELGRKAGKPIVFHCREAYPRLLDILEGQPRHPYLFHCFAGDSADAGRAMALDCYFGVDGPISYKKSEPLREIVRSLPRNRLVVETDSPYLTPEPYRGKPNKPAYVPLVNAALASALGIDPVECAALTTANAERFFHLPKSPI
ncbi:MAG TPA: TatD family hydrolase [Fimbriimonadaceae bacterium]|nr:TatD family hydrolase [Fimbriimonadaceae bacterium]